jgi:hypothetical protein
VSEACGVYTDANIVMGAESADVSSLHRVYPSSVAVIKLTFNLYRLQ